MASRLWYYRDLMSTIGPVTDFRALLTRALAPAEVDDDATEERILDAALHETAAHGLSRATVDDVAARAGVGRMTVFRRFGSKDALIDRLLLREARAFLAEVDRALEALPDEPAEQVAAAFVACVRTGARHPLVSRLARLEPGAALERLAHGDPSPLDLGRAYVSGRIAADRERAGISTARGTPDEVADVLVRLATTYVLVPSPVVDVADEAAARDFAHRVLAPILG